MSDFLSDSEKIVIREYFKDPKISISEIVIILNKERKKWEKIKDNKDKKMKKQVDTRSVSKFKSLALKKIKDSLTDQAHVNRLDLSEQGENKQEKEKFKLDRENLYKMGILEGYDYRNARETYLFYSINQGLVYWPEHECDNDKCRSRCFSDLNFLREEHGLAASKDNHNIKNQFNDTIIEILEKM